MITGQGNGKTTTALGIAVRACGHNMRVCIVQFMRRDLYAGEWDGVMKMGCPVELIPTGKGFCGIQGNPYPYKEHGKNAQGAIQLAHQQMESGQFDILMLDEINNALHLHLFLLEFPLHSPSLFVPVTETHSRALHTLPTMGTAIPFFPPFTEISPRRINHLSEQELGR